MKSYDFEAKAEYRARVWSEIDKVCRVHRSMRKVVYLETREALETVFLLKRGYSPDNLLAVNREPVEMAMLTAKIKRLGLTPVRTAGVDWVRAVKERMSGEAHVLNFDGMGCLHKNLVTLLRQSIVDSGASVVAVNMLGGREAPIERDFLSQRLCRRERLTPLTTYGRRVNPQHFERMRFLLALITSGNKATMFEHLHINSLAWDVYKSTSGQPMVWCVASISSHIDGDERWRKVFNRVGLAPGCRNGFKNALSDNLMSNYRNAERVAVNERS